MAAERLAESLGVDAPVQSAPLKAVPLHIVPLIAPYRSKGLLALRVERVPQLARLTRGRNNGNGSWSLTPEEVDGVEYVGPDSALERPSLAVRLLDNDGATLAMLDLPVVAAGAENLSRGTAADPEYLRRLTDELTVARAALAEREHELTELRGAPRADTAEIERRIAAADAAAATAVDQARRLVRDEETARFAAAETRWRDASDRAVVEAGAKAAAALADAERGWKERLAAAEAKARDERSATAVQADRVRDAEAARLRDQVAGLEATLRSREDEFASLRRDTAAAQQRGQSDLATAEKRWREDEVRRLAAAEKQSQAKSADELKRVTARADAAERALADGKQAQTARDSELRTLRDERSALQARLLEAERAPKGLGHEAVRQQVDTALAAAKAAWETESAAGLAKAERAWRAEAAAKPNGATQDAVTRQIESALAAAKAEWQAAETVRVGLAEQRARSDGAASVPRGLAQEAVQQQIDAAVAAAQTEWRAAEAARVAQAEQRARGEAVPKGLSPEAVQQQVDAALVAARAAWKTEEAGRVARAGEEWRTDAAAALARVTARAETAEAALSKASAAPPPPPVLAAAPPRAAYDDAFIDGLRGEIEELRQALAGREVETAQLRLALETRSPVRESKPKFFPEPRSEPEREFHPANPRRSNGKLIREVLFVFGVIAALAFGFPFVVPYLPYEMQDSIAQMQASVFGTVPAGYTNAPAAKPAAPATAAVGATPAAGTPATVARSANVRATAGASAAVVTRLKKGDAVIVLGTSGSWTHIKTANFEGWVFSSYLKP